MPNSEDIAPADLFTGNKFPCHKFKYIHGCFFLVNILNAMLQQSPKLLKWYPQSRHRIFVGFSPYHSISVPVILNPDTFYISPQFFVVFDDSFIKFLYISPKEEPPYLWD